MGTKIWFTADLHLGHKHIIHFKKERVRKMKLDYNDPEYNDKHTKYIIEQWNNRIDKKDRVYILGDLSFYNREGTRRILEKLNGEKHLIIGNHDKSCKGLENYFESVSQIKTVTFSKHEYDFLNENFIINMCHFPIFSWDRRQHGTVMVHGHTHGNIDEMNELSRELRVDVGYDGKLAKMDFVDLETLYKHCKTITGDLTFKQYIEKKMIEDGTRL